MKFESYKKQVVSTITAAEISALEKIGMAAQADSQLLTPVSTGTLKRSITNQVNGSDKSVAVGTNVEYAGYVHEGTSRQKAQPFIRDAFMQNQDKCRKMVEDELKKAGG